MIDFSRGNFLGFKRQKGSSEKKVSDLQLFLGEVISKGRNKKAGLKGHKIFASEIGDRLALELPFPCRNGPGPPLPGN